MRRGRIRLKNYGDGCVNLHLHRLSDDWETLKNKVIAFMTQFKDGSQALLRYVGLLPN